MTRNLMNVADVFKLRLGSRVDTDRRSPSGLVDWAAGSESAAGGRSFEIKHAPAACMNVPGHVDFFALFIDEGRPEDAGVGMTCPVRNAAGKSYLYDLA